MDVESILKEHTAQDRESFEKLSSDLAALREDITEVKVMLQQAAKREDLTEVKLALQKQRGFFAGITFAVSAVAGAIALAVAWLKS